MLTIDLAQGTFAGLSNTVAFQQVDGDCGACVDEAQTDSFALYGGGHALTLPGIGNDFIFAPGGSSVERSDGTARMTGVVSRSSDLSKAFAVDVFMTDHIDPLSITHPPAGSPKLELSSSAYEDNGGPVDPRDWRYYESFSGILTGLDSLEGAIVQLDRRGPAFQVGPGANGKNVNWGGLGWLDYQTLTQPVNSDSLPEDGTGDFNIDAHGDCIDCTDEAKSHALWMPGLGTQFKFISGGDFEQFVDGTARIVGVVENKADSANQWSVDIQIDGRVNPGSLAHPPAGSPKEELSSDSYADNGGVVDPATWHYYENIEGTMTGLLDNQGDMVVLTRRGPAMQVGVDANGKNDNYGMSVCLDVALFQGGSQSSVDSVGDINIDIGGECEDL
ncbi:MAG: hypothetical protein ACI8TQ_003694 [Planctomycetota bacterium]|jgi:hypothetical protein